MQHAHTVKCRPATPHLLGVFFGSEKLSVSSLPLPPPYVTHPVTRHSCRECTDHNIRVPISSVKPNFVLLDWDVTRLLMLWGRAQTSVVESLV